jgi:hypothetical protein
MHIKVGFPVYVSAAVLPRHTVQKPAIAILHDEFEILEVDAANYPLVARAEYRGNDVHEFRHLDGVFYTRLAVLNNQTAETALLQHFWDKAVLKKARDAAAAFRAGDIIPKGVATKVLRGKRTALDVSKLERVGQTMKLTEAGEAEVEASRSEFKTLMSQTLSIGGDLWVSTPEPMVSVDRIWGRDPTLEGTHFTNVRMHKIPAIHSLGRWLYTLNQLDVVRAMYHPAFSLSLHVDVYDPSVFSHEVPVGFSLSLLRYLSWKRDFPKAYKKRLVEFVESDVARDWDDVASEIEFLLSKASVNGTYRTMLEIELKRIDDRPIATPVFARSPS